MQTLHDSRVLASEIDSLGHMNVRFYMQRMDIANRRLLDQIGVATAGQTFVRRTDTYTRFRREQFEGAPLEVLGGILDVNESGMQSYLELRNPDKNEVAASFVTTNQIIQAADQNAVPFPAGAIDASAERRVEIPRHGRPRSIDLSLPRTDLSADELDARIPDAEGGIMMNSKRVIEIETEDVNDAGWLREDEELMFLPFHKMVRAGEDPPGPPVFETSDGRRMGWAVLEQRTLRYGQPRLGDQLRYFSADLEIAEKTRYSRRWAFDATSGKLMGLNDTVGVCIDLDARKACEWPQEILDAIAHLAVPDLR